MEQVTLAAREALWVSLQVGGPVLVAMLLVGLGVAIFQALTQIQEASLGFLPKVGVLGLALVLLGPFMTGSLRSFTESLFLMAVAVGTAP